MDAANISQAMQQICEEKGLNYETVLSTIESALAAAYRKDFGEKNQNIEVQFNPENGSIHAFDVKEVVEDADLEEVVKTEEVRRAKQEERYAKVKELEEAGAPVPEELLVPVEPEGPTFNEKTEMMLAEARKVKEDALIGETLRMELPVPGDFGRMAAMTAKQVVMQKLREAEREVIFNDFKHTEHTCVTGVVQRREGRVVLIDLGRTTGVLRAEDQVPRENYRTGERMNFYVRSVSLTSRGPEILLSRTDTELVRLLFETEIPEVAEGTVEIKQIAREPGSRTKVAVSTTDESIDPIGACIGQRGMRIQTIIGELGGEKIDIVEWSGDMEAYIANALSPAKVDLVELVENDEGETQAHVTVPEDQLSLAVGKGGQNVRLASRLAGMRIQILGHKHEEQEPEAEQETSHDAPEAPTTPLAPEA